MHMATKATQLSIHGPSRLAGEVRVRGAKNAALPILIAAAAGTEAVDIENVPTDMTDIRSAIAALETVGAQATVTDGRVRVHASSITCTELPAPIAGSFRSSLLFLGLLAGRCGQATITMPGGCDLGQRGFDLHLEGLRRLGANVRISGETVTVSADRLDGTDIHFYLPTTTGTETVMLAACFAKGRTRIFNANTRPEIADMAACLNAMGADISVRNRLVEVVGPIEPKGCCHRVMDGWDEALTYILAAGVTGSEICVRDFKLTHIGADTDYLRRCGLDVFEWGGNVYVSARDRALRAFDLFTAPYPGVNSDLQPLFATLACRCRGESSVTDQRFTERFQYAAELHKMGAEIEAYGNCAVIRGPAKLEGARVRALDLRCGAALVLAGLAAHGTTIIESAHQIERGYERIVSRLKQLGAEAETTPA
jgi:UDP-N-acetylglucosamine 1-carboxyvinyltransferase